MLYGITHSHSRIVTGVSGEPGFNPLDKATSIQLTNSNRTATKFIDNSNWSSIRSLQGRTQGTWYFEVTLGAGDQDESYIGICTDAMLLDEPVVSAQGVGFGNYGDEGASAYPFNGVIYPGYDQSVYSMDTGVAGDVLRVAVDIDSGLIWFAINAGNWNADASADPETRSGGYGFRRDNNGDLMPITGTAWHVAWTAYFLNSTITANFGEVAFAYTPPTDFEAWGTGVSSPSSIIADKVGFTRSYSLAMQDWPNMAISALSNNSAESVAASTKTFTGMSIGAASSDRTVLLLLTKNGTAESISSVVIRPNGDALLEKTCVLTQLFGSGNVRQYLAAAHVPDSYTTADVIVTFSGSGTKDLFCQSLHATGLEFLHPHPYFGFTATNAAYSGFNFISTGSPYQVEEGQKRGGLVIHTGIFGSGIGSIAWSETGMSAAYTFSAAQGGFKASCGIRAPLPSSASHNGSFTLDTSVNYYNSFLLLR